MYPVVAKIIFVVQEPGLEQRYGIPQLNCLVIEHLAFHLTVLGSGSSVVNNEPMQVRILPSHHDL
jgi:hypothetical protein